MTLHNILLHLIGVGLFFTLLLLLFCVCRIADSSLVTQSRISSRHTSSASLSNMVEASSSADVPMHLLGKSLEEERRRFIY